MNSGTRIPVVFLWHMHQPDYRDCVTGEYYFPWTYLHALKDYVDMAAHLEAHPGCKAVFNFVPILIEQLADYASQLKHYLERGDAIKDPLLALLTSAERPAPGSERFADLLAKCTRANRERIIERFCPYRQLVNMLDTWQQDDALPCYFNQQYLTDMAVWYHLGWLGETVRRSDKRVTKLQEQGTGFTPEHCTQLLEIIHELMADLLPRYRRLAESGQAEIITSPYAHPILPLLQDFASTREAMPDALLPAASHYPGGQGRAIWHLEKGLAVFKDHFGFRPKGCWASEGSLSDSTLALLSEVGFKWSATGDSVMYNSLKLPANEQAAQRIEQQPDKRHSVFSVADKATGVFFRDDGLSDKIGFEYANWHADDAVGDFLHHLENIAKSASNPEDCVISIIMDGENAWEYYPENAYYFLDALYARLEDHPRLYTTTYSEWLETTPKSVALNSLCAGSWVYGTFSTWIADSEKNKAWDILCQAKLDYDSAVEAGLAGDSRRLADLQLALCEGSDWFWWFGDYNPSDSVRDFDYLFRQHVTNLYNIIGKKPPEKLATPISKGSGSPANGGVMRQGHL
ncbi:glycoside hydrolase family 57 protein [Gilvimarinus algae]|uniref:Glycoside hydrolase family 57 protein n=1 Tax=Gilvimarinus algae TaxID=3058037 RepID=A0ABT8TEE3_9GAMM|nr:glycoside hydrolase family 57 protein [Gilvimarinus sp. SDUM040014]MDO3382471.1 glycoside hydrolase family 57 protein [Gilvimarinus sp. SDUM040014]